MRFVGNTKHLILGLVGEAINSNMGFILWALLPISRQQTLARAKPAVTAALGDAPLGKLEVGGLLNLSMRGTNKKVADKNPPLLSKTSSYLNPLARVGSAGLGRWINKVVGN